MPAKPDAKARPANELGLRHSSRFWASSYYPTLSGTLGRWPYNSKTLAPDDSDTYHTVRNGQEYNLPLLSYDAYGTPFLYWALAIANGITNTFVAPSVGDIIRIPAIERVSALRR